MASPRHLLLLTEDPTLAPLLGPLVAEGGGFALTAAKPGEAENLAALRPWHAALADGEAALLPLASRPFPAPVLLLGAAEARPGAVAALRKPVRAAELLAALARLDARPAGEVALGPALRLDPAGRWLSGGDGVRVRLTEKEAAILLHLRRAAPRPVPKEELLGEVWGYAEGVATHTLETHLYRLRRKLAQGLRAEGLVVTGPGGYRLEAAP